MVSEERARDGPACRRACLYEPPPSAREYSVAVTFPDVIRGALRLLFGDALPRSARSLRRRRANLRRKRQTRKKHR